MQRLAWWSCACLLACQADPLPPRARFADQVADAKDGANLADGATSTAADATATSDGTSVDASADVSADVVDLPPAPCAPCKTNADCPAKSACLDHGSLPAYCGAPCVDNGCATAGWQCKTRKSTAGIDVTQCAPISDKCPCPVGGPETCNVVDDDCDGQTDEDTCSDANNCTDDVCTPSGVCKNPAKAAACNDGDDCSLDDQCKEGKCTAGAPKSCTDGNDCTDDGCTQGKCTNVPHTKPCNDGNACTSGDVCSPKGCAGTAKSCADPYDCTVDECAPVNGECLHKPVDKVCEDSDPCTTYTCSATKGCQWLPTACKDDGNPCTDESCQLTGCVSTNKAALAPCTINGQAGQCNGSGKCCPGTLGSSGGC